MSDNADSPLEVLDALANLSQGDSAIDEKKAVVSSWRGFCFQVETINVVFLFKGGFEILPSRQIQVIPWAKEWLYGVTNVRGEVYTVVDFARFLGFEGVRSLRSASLFLLPAVDLRSTLLIDNKVHLRSFSELLEHADTSAVPEVVRPFVSVVLVDAGQQWVVVDVDALCSAAEFTDASVVPPTAAIGNAA